MHSPSEFNNWFTPFFFPVYLDEKKLKCSKSKFVNQLIKKGIGLLPEYNCIISKWKWADRYLSDKYICKNAISISKKSFNLFINENYNKYLSKKKKLRVIFRGINVDYYNQKNISILKQENLRQDWKLASNKFIILMPGRLTYWKGQEKFIDSLNILTEDYHFTEFQAIMLGSDQGRNVYKKKLINLVERYNLNKKVKFINHCKEMPLAYSLADVVVSASIEPEAFGRVAVEAQSMGKPIVASNIGGSKETILNKKSGFLYKFDDPRELAKSLNTVIQLSQDDLISMGNEGRKNIAKKFDVDIMCDTNLNEYKKLLKS